MTNWVRLKILGEGSYGVVFLAKPTTGTLDNFFAIKATHLQHYSSLSKEKQILKHFIGCPEIVQYLGSEITIEKYSPDMAFYNLKLEYAAGGTLADLIKQKQKLPENEVKQYLKMILRGLSCIHRKGFVHVDLKPSNILAFPQSDGKTKLKIADFGLSRRRGEDDGEDYRGVPRFKGTPKYMSPESVIFSEVKSSLDIWSLGCILVEMVSGRSVWEDCRSRREFVSKLVCSEEMPEIPEELSEEGKDFIGRCFDRDHERRWTADMLLRHPYVREEKEEGMTAKLPGRPKFPKGIYLPHLQCKLRSCIQIAS